VVRATDPVSNLVNVFEVGLAFGVGIAVLVVGRYYAEREERRGERR
jgi:hypothetical protein